jgi:ABC-type dipeptide/oligopeptide/nickel transport system ATPase subunit
MTDREFTVKAGVREAVPLLLGIMGPSGGGKTFSALRLATGIQRVTGGDIYGIDTEARRMLHYADRFKFKHLQFDAPFRSLDYLAAIKHCAAQGARIIIIDSMSHEHEGPGGMLDFHDREYERLGNKESVNMLAWKRPKAERRDLLNGILQIPASFIFCFRAKEKIKMVKNDRGKQEVVPQGWMPIAGEEFVFEMTASCLLLPRANGVPTWESGEPGERTMMKLPLQFQTIFSESKPLSEDIGEQLAQWAAGGAQAPAKPATVEDHSTLLLAAREQAKGGRTLMEGWWKTLSKQSRVALKDYTNELKAIAEEADARRNGKLDPTPSTGGEAPSSAGSTTPTTVAEGDVI